MVTLADSLVSTASRPLPIRMRPDLSARPQTYQGRRYWVVKDPVGLNYFRFQEEEFALLQMLDGRTSLEEMKQRFEREHPPGKISVEELGRFVGNLHQSGVVIADVPGQGRQLHQRAGKRRWKELQGKFTNILAVRFRGIDPTPLLARLYPRVRWAFSPAAVVASLLLMLAALLLVTVQFEVFLSRLPAFHEFFHYKNWLLLAAALAVTKICHEFGHGLTCRHFGGECHELGVMFLVLTPCLYCNVSDSWMLPNKWHRAAIGAAGMWVELTFAAAATFVWWFTEPGLLNYLALSTMFVCSVSTLLFNGNPLLRYDGYYILSDIMEVPNLRQKASSILNRKLSAWLLGMEHPHDPFLPRRRQGLFACYTVAAAVYRWVVVISILFFLYKVFEPHGLQVLGKLLILTALYGMVVHPLVRMFKWFAVPGRLSQVKRARFYGVLAALGAALLAALAVPLPHHVTCPVQIDPRGATTVYVEVPGILSEVSVQPGLRVAEGAPLARLVSTDVSYELAEIAARRDVYQARYDSLMRFERHKSDGALREQELIEQSLESVERQLAQRTAEAAKLQLRAPLAGVVLPPPPHRQTPREGVLPGWSGSPLDAENLGALLLESQPFCRIGEPDRLEAVLVIDQSRIEFVEPGQRVEIMLEQYPGRVFRTTIEQVSSRDLEISPQRLSTAAGGELETRTDADGRQRPASTSYQAKAFLEDDTGELRIGLRGTAKIHTPRQTLGARGWRLFSETFNFRL